MLKDLTSENLIRLNIEATDWEDAVRKAAQPLLEAGKVKQSYIDDIIVGAKESGPYFVLAQHVALPHARPEAGALESAIGVATLATPVELSARNNTEHLDALADLAERLEDQEFFKMLDQATDPKEVLDYLSK